MKKLLTPFGYIVICSVLFDQALKIYLRFKYVDNLEILRIFPGLSIGLPGIIYDENPHFKENSLAIRAILILIIGIFLFTLRRRIPTFFSHILIFLMVKVVTNQFDLIYYHRYLQIIQVWGRSWEIAFSPIDMAFYITTLAIVGNSLKKRLRHS